MASLYSRFKEAIRLDQIFWKSGAGALVIFHLIKTLSARAQKGTTLGLRPGRKFHPFHFHETEGRQSTIFSQLWTTVHHWLNYVLRRTVTTNTHFTEENRMQTLSRIRLSAYLPLAIVIQPFVPHHRSRHPVRAQISPCPD
jgi:hypothetical protein